MYIISTSCIPQSIFYISTCVWGDDKHWSKRSAWLLCNIMSYRQGNWPQVSHTRWWVIISGIRAGLSDSVESVGLTMVPEAALGSITVTNSLKQGHFRSKWRSLSSLMKSDSDDLVFLVLEPSGELWYWANLQCYNAGPHTHSTLSILRCRRGGAVRCGLEILLNLWKRRVEHVCN